jgi:hypothetical protein
MCNLGNRPALRPAPRRIDGQWRLRPHKSFPEVAVQRRGGQKGPHVFGNESGPFGRTKANELLAMLGFDVFDPKCSPIRSTRPISSLRGMLWSYSVVREAKESRWSRIKPGGFPCINRFKSLNLSGLNHAPQPNATQ